MIGRRCQAKVSSSFHHKSAPPFDPPKELAAKINPKLVPGFYDYLRAGNGQKFVSLHFDQFHCARSSALCSSTGCMHRVFVINGSGQAREVWHAQVHEINMDDRAGRAEVDVNCADFCASRLLWNGSRFSK